jgi:hypothetical protein
MRDLSLSPDTLAVLGPPMFAWDLASLGAGQTVTYQRPGRKVWTNRHLPVRNAPKGIPPAFDVSILPSFPSDPRPTCWIDVRSRRGVEALSLGGASGKQPLQVVARGTSLPFDND